MTAQETVALYYDGWRTPLRVRLPPSPWNQRPQKFYSREREQTPRRLT
jgi:hypothetical protein